MSTVVALARWSRVRVLPLALAALATPAGVSAQMVDTTDPCYVAFFRSNPDNVFARGSWENRDHVTRAAAELWQIMQIWDSGTAMAMAGDASPEMLELLRVQFRCLDWIRRLQRRLDEQLGKLGVAAIALPDQRHQPTPDELAEQTRELLERIERRLEQILRK